MPKVTTIDNSHTIAIVAAILLCRQGIESNEFAVAEALDMAHSIVSKAYYASH